MEGTPLCRSNLALSLEYSSDVEGQVPEDAGLMKLDMELALNIFILLNWKKLQCLHFRYLAKMSVCLLFGVGLERLVHGFNVLSNMNKYVRC